MNQLTPEERIVEEIVNDLEQRPCVGDGWLALPEETRLLTKIAWTRIVDDGIKALTNVLDLERARVRVLRAVTEPVYNAAMEDFREALDRSEEKTT